MPTRDQIGIAREVLRRLRPAMAAVKADELVALACYLDSAVVEAERVIAAGRHDA